MNLRLVALVSTIVFFSGGLDAVAQSDYVQPAEQFSAAINDNSTNIPFVLITAIDGNTKQLHYGCTPGRFLVAAIMKERGMPDTLQSTEEGRRIALSSPTHVYTFYRAEALANLNFEKGGQRYARICEIIRSGHPAYIADRSGEIREGQP